MKFRREANQADNRAASVSVDSLINYEAVKVSLALCFTYENYHAKDSS
jgi:ATP-binding cassette subfamily B (MDR/TAP) protein 7